MVHPNGFQDFPCFLEEYSIPNSFMKLPVSTESFSYYCILRGIYQGII